MRLLANLNDEIAAMEDRIEALYEEADPKGIVVSTPGIGVTLSAGILGASATRAASPTWPGCVRSPASCPGSTSPAGQPSQGLTKAGDPGLREALFLAADLAHKVDPTLAARYHRLVVAEGRHHTPAVCTLAAVMATRIAACWRRGESYVLRDVDGTAITETEGRRICAERDKAQQQTRRAGRGSEESTEAAPASDPPTRHTVTDAPTSAPAQACG